MYNMLILLSWSTLVALFIAYMDYRLWTYVSIIISNSMP